MSASSFDLDLPLEIDDIYWSDEHGFKQPSDVPSKITFFNHFIKLTQVVAFTSRTIVSFSEKVPGSPHQFKSSTPSTNPSSSQV